MLNAKPTISLFISFLQAGEHGKMGLADEDTHAL